MRLTTVKVDNEELAAILFGQKVILIRDINEIAGANWTENILSILQNGQLSQINSWYKRVGNKEITEMNRLVLESVTFAPLYRHPEKIWGVGMNYIDKAIELSGKPPEEEPVIFMKPNSSLIGPEDDILLPYQSTQVTAEAELAIIIGKTCKNVEEADVPGVVAGFTTSLDMTAKDIHAKNPRYIQRAKSFDTFFSFGPYLTTIDEVKDVRRISVETKLNGEVYHSNTVSNMMYSPWWIVSFFSRIMTLHPGDVIMTGTPGSVLISDGDVVESLVEGIGELRNYSCK
ncbi:fumarylacetoacetate hydrolase family protein [Metabacillus halosaccharovorans]|uniref:fumarylacetoacetate hydrolase family protein n=1 Tax=Metabacillus halosaccharovorans TaxID=930124 RepID=UPI000995AE42|nr:fumarylacetoacetate hydrolase family protein [Metabacillus halosaccharovorans]